MRDPDDEQHDRRATNRPSMRRRRPAPAGALADRDEQHDEPRPTAAPRPPSRPCAGRLDRRLGDEEAARRPSATTIGDERRARTASGSRGASTIGPASTMPSAAADARGSPRSSRSRSATLSRGNSSRMIPNASGKIAPPAPWSTPADDHHRDRVASAATSVPPASTASAMTSMRSLPNMSPRRPSDRRQRPRRSAGSRSASTSRRSRTCAGRAGSPAAPARRATAAARTTCPPPRGRRR